MATEVVAGASLRLEAAERAGIARERIVLDPGIGFAKMPGQSIAMLHSLGALLALGCPILVGVSRKHLLVSSPVLQSPRSEAPVLWRPGCWPWRTAHRFAGSRCRGNGPGAAGLDVLSKLA